MNKVLQCNPQHFFEYYWHQAYYHYSTSKDINVPFNIEKFNNILRYYPLDYRNLRIFSDGGLVPLHRYTNIERGQNDSVINKDKLFCPGFLEGKTLVLNNIQQFDEELLMFSKQMEEIFGCQVKMNAYYTIGNAKGANPHYDSHHLFAVQLEGEKIWNLGKIEFAYPTEKVHPFPKKAEFTEQLTLKAGETLYVPPGLWHEVETYEYSLHITIGLFPKTWGDLLFEHLEKATENHEIFRSEVPMVINNDGNCQYGFLNQGDIEKLLKLVAQQTVDVQLSAKQMHVLHQPQIKDAIQNIEDDTLKQQISCIWSVIDFPVAVYIRGSFVQQQLIYQPWDIDLIFIVKQKSRDTYTKIFNNLMIQGLPFSNLDIQVVTEQELLENKMLLVLFKDALYLYGAEIDQKIVQQKVQKISSEELICSAVLEIDGRLDYLMQFEESLFEDEIKKRRKNLVKRLLRLGGMKQYNKSHTLIRDPLVCAEYLLNYKSIKRDVEQILEVFPNYITAEHMKAIKRIIDKIKEVNYAIDSL